MLRNAFIETKQAAITIQRSFRRYYYKTREIKKQWEQYEEEYKHQINELKALEHYYLFGIQDTKGPEYLNHIKPLSPFKSQKISYFSLVIDFYSLVILLITYSLIQAQYIMNLGLLIGQNLVHNHLILIHPYSL